MASLHDGISSFQIGMPHFFKIILDNTIRDGRLWIPKRFVRKYGNELSNPVQLKVPNGDLWSMEFGKSDSEVWLQKGWREFMEYYCLTQGFLLVFEYQTNRRFHVFMFDKSASEVAYPLSMNSNVEEHKFQAPKMDDMGDDISVDILDSSPSKRTEKETQSKRSRPNKMSRNNAGKAKYRQSLLKSDPKRKISDAGSFSLRLSRAFDTRSNFTSEYPFFVRALRVYQLKRMRVPNFIVNLMKKNLIIMLQDGVESWPVKLHSGRMSRGWHDFAKDNSLQAGDVCAFEMIKKDVLLVSIFRNGS